jgi:RNA polymerase sigma-70 factor (ECF subfamily)
VVDTQTTQATNAGSAAAPGARAQVIALRVPHTDEDIARGLRDGKTWAQAALFDIMGREVAASLRRLLGYIQEADLEDLVSEVFMRAIESAASLRNASSLRAWLRTITVRTGYRYIRRRKAQRWLRFWEPADVAAVPTDAVSPSMREAYQRTYAALDRLPANERVVFCLRYIDGLALKEVASAGGISLATAKRRLLKARERFGRAARQDEVLAEFLAEGGRWTS